MGKRAKQLEQMTLVHPHAAGLDIGAREIYACVPAKQGVENVQVFGTFTPDLVHIYRKNIIKIPFHLTFSNTMMI